jgi:[glutamine synthetase] adenylyltransferase / [glutamine synthetase]-adenylyl-L-tyrosine phosphorylase
MEAAAEQDDAGDDPGLAEFMRAAATDPALRPLLDSVFGNSPFLGLCLHLEPAILRRMVEDGADAAFETLLADLAVAADAVSAQPELMRLLRVAKRRIALLAALADIAGLWTLGAVTGALSRFAEAAIHHAVRFLLRRAADKGEVVVEDLRDPERESGLIVLGMGKLGAFELNYSSDIDLIVFYDHEKVRYTGRRSLPECMIALTKDLVRILDERNGDGYVFRTDLRLRPDPGATPVAVSLAAAEIYYEGFGQNWERAAMIKARPVGGDPVAGEAFIEFLRPFIWRRSLDFAAIQDIHSIKRQINAHHGGRTIAIAGHNVKLGRGGIREIEFFAQTQQLIWGGRERAVRVQTTIGALHALAGAGHVEPAVASELEAAYCFLRGIEHRLQMVDDQQTQILPSDPVRLTEIALFCGFAGLEEFSAALTTCFKTVEGHYARLFEDAPALGAHGNLVFTGGENDPETVRTLTELGFTNADALCSTIRGWHHGRVRATRTTRAREMLTELTPALLVALATTARPDEAFMRFDDFLAHLPAGVPLFALFTSNPSLLDLVAEIMGNAPLLAEHLSRRPNLLDAVLQANFFDPIPDAAELAAELAEALDLAGDQQEVLDTARRWANDRRFQVGVQVLRGIVEPDGAARAFTAIAEAAVACMARQVIAEFSRVHGTVPGGEWCILAMGKMGGREMTATSDLDLILVYDAPAEVEDSTGPRPLAVPAWYARMTQRLVTALTAPTGEGALYEVDMRLRPSGNSGPIASSLEAFSRYQQDSAWTWEHMALTRARVVAGDPGLSAQVEAVVTAVLTRPRDPAALVKDVADMRERMAKEHKARSHWQVKHLRGGLVDIEFTAQYLQLRHAHDHPTILARNTRDTLQAAAELGLLARPDLDILIEAWLLWSAVQLVLRQTIAGEFDERNAPAGLKDVLVRATGLTDFKTLVDRMDDCAARALAVFTRIVIDCSERLEP